MGIYSFPVTASGGGGGGGSPYVPTIIDVSKFAGATLGDKLAAAVAANPAGGVFDLRRMTGVQSSGGVTITIKKPCKILFGAMVCTITAGPFIILNDGVSFVDRTDSADGAEIEGAGFGVTKFVAAAAVTPLIRSQAWDTHLHHFSMRYTTVDAGSLCIDMHIIGPSGDLLRPRISFCHFTTGTAEDDEVPEVDCNGKGVSLGNAVLGGSIGECHFTGFDVAIELDGCNVPVLYDNRVHSNVTGVDVLNNANFVSHDNIYEGNWAFGWHVRKTFGINSVNDYFEQAIPALQIQVDDVAGDSFGRYISIHNAIFSNEFSGIDVLYNGNGGAGGTFIVDLQGGSMPGPINATGTNSFVYMNRVTEEQLSVRTGQVVRVFTRTPVGVIDPNTFTGYPGAILKFDGYDSYDFNVNLQVSGANLNVLYNGIIDGQLNVNGKTITQLFRVWQSTDSVGIGTDPVTNSRLVVSSAVTAINAYSTATTSLMEYSPSADSGGTAVAIAGTCFTVAGNTKDPGLIIGGDFGADHRGNSALSIADFVYGVRGSAATTGTAGSASNADAFVALVAALNGSTIGLGVGFLANAPSTAGGSTIGTFISFYALNPTAATNNFCFISEGGKFIHNNSNVDADFRINGNSANFVFFVDASVDSVGFGTPTPSALVHIASFVATSGNPMTLLVNDAAHTGLTASAEHISIQFALSQTIQHATGALTTQRAFVINPPSYSFVAASTIDDTATMAITGPPGTGTFATILRKYSFWVQSGMTRVDGEGMVLTDGAGVGFYRFTNNSTDLYIQKATDANKTFSTVMNFMSFLYTTDRVGIWTTGPQNALHIATTDVRIDLTVAAVGGAATALLGLSGDANTPTVATQNGWATINLNGTPYFVPLWV